MGSPTITPNVGFQLPAYGQQNWQVPLQFDFQLLDQIFGGQKQIPALSVESLTIASIVLTAAQIVAALNFNPLDPKNNLADVANPATALANLGGIGPGSLKGPYSGTTTYNYGNLVTYNGATYSSIYQGAQSGNEPDTSPSYWSLFLSSSPVTPFSEAPTGTGSTRTLSAAPFAVIGIFQNGVLLNPATDYSISGTTLTFGFTPATSDVFRAVYLKGAGSAQGGGGGSAPPTRVTPTGTINGTNPTFTLSVVPASGLFLYQNGLLVPTANYTLAGSTVTFAAGHIPNTGDTLDALCYV